MRFSPAMGGTHRPADHGTLRRSALSFGRVFGGAVVALLLAGPAATQEPVREPASASGPTSRIRPSLRRALVRLLAVHDDQFRLARKVMETPDPEDWDEATRREMARHVAPLEHWFPDKTVSVRWLLRMELHHAGAEEFARAWREDEAITPDDLLFLIDPSVLRAPPVGPSEAWDWAEKERRRAHQAPAREIPLLGNGLAAYLLWGALRSDDYWKARDEEEGPGARSRFLSRTIAIGSEDPVALRDVIFCVLEPPIETADGAPPEDSWMIAGPFENRRGRVGFGPEHLEPVRAAHDEAMEWLDKAAETNDQAIMQEADARLWWAEGLKHRVGREVPMEDAMSSGVGETEDYDARWRALGARLSFEELRQRVLDRFLAAFRDALTGEGGDPERLQRIRDLIALGAARSGAEPAEVERSGEGLSDAERRELKRLLEQRALDLAWDAQAGFRYLSGRGFNEGRSDEVLAFLTGTLPDVAAGVEDRHSAEQMLLGAWDSFLLLDAFVYQGPNTRRLADEVFEGGGPPLTAAIRVRLVRALDDLLKLKRQNEAEARATRRSIMKALHDEDASVQKAALRSVCASFGDRAWPVVEKELFSTPETDSESGRIEKLETVVETLRSAGKKRGFAWSERFVHRMWGLADDGSLRSTSLIDPTRFSNDSPPDWIAWTLKRLPRNRLDILVAAGRVPPQWVSGLGDER